MDTLRDTLMLALFASGFLGVGVGVGVMWHHFSLGWFISLCSQHTLEAAVESAEKHVTRRRERRHRREREKRILAENGHGRPAGAGRHLAR
jgi:hypothetical protein